MDGGENTRKVLFDPFGTMTGMFLCIWDLLHGNNHKSWLCTSRPTVRILKKIQSLWAAYCEY